jgi:hypothetical protein
MSYNITIRVDAGSESCYVRFNPLGCGFRAPIVRASADQPAQVNNLVCQDHLREFIMNHRQVSLPCAYSGIGIVAVSWYVCLLLP